MDKTKNLKPLQVTVTVYLLCFALRGAEYFWIRTDQSILGEAFLHKLVGILILAMTIDRFAFKWSEIGFIQKHLTKKILYGLLLGTIVYIIAYGCELLLQISKGNLPKLAVYVTSYAVDGNQGNRTELHFFAFCIIGNIINVVMEEGLFRGLFIKLFEFKYSFIKAAFFSSVLFGLWHIAAPVRSLFDGEISQTGAILSGLMLVLTTGLTSFKFCLLAKLSGSLWMPMADHFFNNTVINLLHIVTVSGSDELQILRITIAQTVSFLIVLIIYIKNKKSQMETLRT